MKRHMPKPSQPDDRTETVGARSWEALWSDALQLLNREQRPAGEGWKTVFDLVTEMGISRYGVAYHMRLSLIHI